MPILWLMLAILGWSLLHSFLASFRAKAFARRLFGPHGERFYRLGYNLFAGFSLVLLLALASRLPDRNLYSVPLPWVWFMLAGQFAGMLLLLIGFLQSHPLVFLGLEQLGAPLQEKGKLAVGGLYHYVRHPLYSAGLLILWLVPRMSVNLLLMNLAFTAYILIGANLEERKLRSEFGQQFETYMAATPMFVPFLDRNKSRQGRS